MSRDPVIIIGAGAAGLVAALRMAPRPVTLFCAGEFGTGTASGWAQGGIAAAVGGDDAPALHAADTIAAGAGLCDATAVERIVAAGDWVVSYLQNLGAGFACDPNGRLELGLEAAHGRRRIVHAADATGAEVMRVLLAAVRNCPSIQVLQHARVTELLVRDNVVQGVIAATSHGMISIASSLVVLATGGIGGLFAQTTNPLLAQGSGLGLAARAGASLRDIEFVQFHPTALHCGLDPMPLVSEALRGEGAVFVDATGEAFMQGGDLAARDIVARAVAAKLAAGSAVFLDARCVPAVEFPSVFAACRANNIDPATSLIPVRPAAHYHIGGVAVNATGESSVRGLFACGEVASTGLHGGNRLASNSLLEAIVTGRMVAEACTGHSAFAPVISWASRPPPGEDQAVPEIRNICSAYLGILRNETGLNAALAQLEPWVQHSNSALVAWLLAHAALRRRESRGAHFRTDFPATEAIPAVSSGSHISEISNLRQAA